MAGTLFLVATPIGNLKDMTERGIEVLNQADLIAAEDTRNSIKLLNHFDIKTPMTSYHEYNKYEKADSLISALLAGKNIALITDAGTPGISDPGEVLVQKCYENGINVTSLPGCCALINALIISGLPTRRFSFEAFLPSDKKERNRILNELRTDTRTIILYEAPHHLLRTLKELRDVLGNREIALCKELTKKFENVNRTDLDSAVEYYTENEPKGEFVLVLSGENPSVIENNERESWSDFSIEEHMDFYLEQGLDKKDAMKKVAENRGISKRDVYQALLK
ncbi:MAG: 16S rRNA (cytidine(1402)-2'-O)-methyltransferase [Lachnospiraceae bacterium]|nr:16S rRNA (cytidine(1402)-2'-O)-methyltransferase [Lachnospiraceae bacterium]